VVVRVAGENMARAHVTTADVRTELGRTREVAEVDPRLPPRTSRRTLWMLVACALGVLIKRLNASDEP
jgi:hypothetical protein